ncbi:hypothetical protein [Ancylobacter sp. IITR112]|uniref:hypothetical protein n=1 Tax=Ancylobacter sp. IITR112 TaxID=3138073 RepID=UPI00352B9807
MHWPTQGPKLVFTHIPKSAGTSLRHALRAALQAERVADGFDRSLYGGFSGFHAFGPEARATTALSLEELPAAPDIVIGHYAASTTRARYPQAPHMTVLREARARALSLWIYWRSVPPAALAGWGGWGRYVARATAPLADFLSDREVAAQTDNVGLRLLLWPHPLIPDSGFIAEKDDAPLLALAKGVLDSFDFVDVIENPRFESRLAGWVGGGLRLERLNESLPVPAELSVPLAQMLTPEAMAALAQRSRLDDVLWRHVARLHLPAERIEAVREAAYAAAIARHALLMAG